MICAATHTKHQHSSIFQEQSRARVFVTLPRATTYSYLQEQSRARVCDSMTLPRATAYVTPTIACMLSRT